MFFFSSIPEEFQARTERLEAEIRERSAQVDGLTAQLEETQAEKSQLVQQVASINSLLEASQNKKEEDNNQVRTLHQFDFSEIGLQLRPLSHLYGFLPFLQGQVNDAEVEQLKNR